jgi:tetratricopeptide (TPR) repeat protein
MAQPPQPSSSSLSHGKKKLILWMIGGTILVAAGAGVIGVVNPPPSDQVITPPDPTRERVDARFQMAKNLIRERKWTEAKAALQEVQLLSPGYSGASDYLAQVEKEIPNQAHLTVAEAALAKGDLATAKAELEQVSQDTVMFEQVGKLRRELQEATDKKAREAQADSERVVIQGYPPPPPLPNPWQMAVGRFVEGDMMGAMTLAEVCMRKSPKSRCKSGFQQMKEFTALYKKLEEQDAKGLARLFALDKEITGEQGPSKMAQRASTRASNVFYKSAASAKAAGQWTRAFEYSRKALQADPGHVGAQRIVRELREKAQDMMHPHYHPDDDPDQVVERFRQIMAMTPPEDELHQKAKSWIEKLAR